MTEILKTNPTALRACIFYECRRTKNVEVAFKNFCDAIGDDVIEYVDFEYWFYRFYHGNLDLDHDRSTDPMSLILSDLPTEILNEIVGYLDIRNRFNVRKVSRKFENVVDNFKSEYDEIIFFVDNHKVQFHIEDYIGHYKNGKNGCLFQYNFDEANAKHLKVELSALSTVLTNSKSLINHFRVSTVHPDTIDIMPKLIESLSKDICPIFYAKRVRLLPDNDYIIPILSLFKAGVLEDIMFEDTKFDDDTFAELVKMDQFKQLKSIGCYVCKPISLSQFKQLSHLTSFRIYMGHDSAEDIVILRDILSQFANLESAEIKLYGAMDLSKIRTALGIDDDNCGEIIYSHPISNSDKLLILIISTFEILVYIENN